MVSLEAADGVGVEGVVVCGSVPGCVYGWCSSGFLLFLWGWFGGCDFAWLCLWLVVGWMLCFCLMFDCLFSFGFICFGICCLLLDGYV